jgi:hypothetical protein
MMTKLRLAPAERMRLYRKRQRQGLQYVRSLLHVTDIDGLIHLGLLNFLRKLSPKSKL